MLIAKFESVYTGSGNHGSSMVSHLAFCIFFYLLASWTLILAVPAVCIRHGTRASCFAKVVVLQ